MLVRVDNIVGPLSEGGRGNWTQPTRRLVKNATINKRVRSRWQIWPGDCEAASFDNEMYDGK